MHGPCLVEPSLAEFTFCFLIIFVCVCVWRGVFWLAMETDPKPIEVNGKMQDDFKGVHIRHLEFRV